MENTTTMQPRRMRVQVRDENGRFLREWFIEVYPSGDDEKDALRGVLHLRDILVWGPEQNEPDHFLKELRQDPASGMWVWTCTCDAGESAALHEDAMSAHAQHRAEVGLR